MKTKTQTNARTAKARHKFHRSPSLIFFQVGEYFEFPALEVPRSKFKIHGNFKIIFLVPNPIIYNPGLPQKPKSTFLKKKHFFEQSSSAE